MRKWLWPNHANFEFMNFKKGCKLLGGTLCGLFRQVHSKKTPFEICVGYLPQSPLDLSFETKSE